jgi:putative SOS response-associated peptidase YedK
MCGKFTQMMSWGELVHMADLVGAPASPLEAVRPMSFAKVIRLNPRGKREIARMRWGLVPSWQKDPATGTRHIHARAESIDERRAFRDAFNERRGLIVVSTFNVAKDLTPTKREQHVVTPNDGKPLGLAVIWERWSEPHAGELLTFAMITVAANRLIGTVTDRMPAVIQPNDWAKWLGEEWAPIEEIKAMLVPFEGNWQMAAQAKTAKGGKPGRQSPQPGLF